jgi:hypothetical protein
LHERLMIATAWAVSLGTRPGACGNLINHRN